jgi:hypothetical protein
MTVSSADEDEVFDDSVLAGFHLNLWCWCVDYGDISCSVAVGWSTFSEKQRELLYGFAQMRPLRQQRTGVWLGQD